MHLTQSLRQIPSGPYGRPCEITIIIIIIIIIVIIIIIIIMIMMMIMIMAGKAPNIHIDNLIRKVVILSYSKFYLGIS